MEQAWQVLDDHVPVRRWFGRRLRCACGDPHPCRVRMAALYELASRWQRIWS